MHKRAIFIIIMLVFSVRCTTSSSSSTDVAIDEPPVPSNIAPCKAFNAAIIRILVGVIDLLRSSCD